jgi:hypothetical protein
MLAAVVLGVAVSVLGILLQGASAAGVSLWSSLKGVVIENTLHSRFGEVWGARAIEDVAGDEAGPEAGQTAGSQSTSAPAPAPAAEPTSGNGASKGLGIAALILGALGLIAGLSALVVVSEFDHL